MTERDRNTSRLFALAALAATAGQHQQVAVYAGEAVAAAGKLLLTRIAFDQLTVAYKSLVDDRRGGWRMLDLRRQQGQYGNGNGNGDSDNVDRGQWVASYMQRLAREIVDLCHDFCRIVDRHLLPGLSAASDIAHAHKLKADFFRYTYEISDGSLKEWSAAKACKSYQRGYDTLCRAKYSPRDHARLDLAVNFAVCLECIFGAEHAAAFARRAIHAATATDDDNALPATGRNSPAATMDADGSKSLRDLRDYLTHLDVRRCTGRNRNDCVSASRSDDNDSYGAAVDLAPGFCTSDTSDTESEL